MFSTNRRHTEALEKSARALQRIANAEETIAKHIGDLLREEEDDSAEKRASTRPGNSTGKDSSPKR